MNTSLVLIAYEGQIETVNFVCQVQHSQEQQRLNAKLLRALLKRVNNYTVWVCERNTRARETEIMPLGQMQVRD